MKNRMIAIWILLVVAIISVLPLTKALAGYAHNPQPKLAEDILDSLMVVPKTITDRFGNDGERVRLIYNVSIQREFIVSLEKRIAALEKQVAALSKSIEIKGDVGKLEVKQEADTISNTIGVKISPKEPEVAE